MRHQEICNEAVQGLSRQSSSHLRIFAGKYLSILCLLLLPAAGRSARADDQIRAVRLSNVVGSVQILNGTETQFSQAYPNMPLMQGSTLKTGEDGRAEIQFEDGSVVRLTPNSSAAMSVLKRTSEGNANTEVDLLTGLSYVEMKGTANQRFVVHFLNNDVISPAPVKFRVNLDAKPAEFAVLDGSAHLSSGMAYAVDVHANETVRFGGTDSGHYFVAQGVDPDSWDQWNADRDQAMSQMAAQETREARGSMNPGDPGWSDLDYNGNWYASGGSSFWVPNGAGAGWDPYGSGYWGYYGGAGGYAWISGYPWGWLPYHCGNWNYYNSVGWGWSPGGCGTNWYPFGSIGYAPRWYHRLPNPQPVRHPASGGSLHPAVSHSLIAVDRGPEATTLTPRVGAAPRTVAIGHETAQLLSKTANPTVATVARPAYPGSTYSSHIQSGFGEGRQLGSVPVFRPSTPASAYHSSASSFAGSPPSGGESGHFSAPSAGSSSMSSTSSMSSAGHASSGGGGGMSGGGGGGGHH